MNDRFGSPPCAVAPKTSRALTNSGLPSNWSSSTNSSLAAEDLLLWCPLTLSLLPKVAMLQQPVSLCKGTSLFKTGHHRIAKGHVGGVLRACKSPTEHILACASGTWLVAACSAGFHWPRVDPPDATHYFRGHFCTVAVVVRPLACSHRPPRLVVAWRHWYTKVCGVDVVPLSPRRLCPPTAARVLRLYRPRRPVHR